MDTLNTVVTETTKLSPVLAIQGIQWFGYSINDIVQLVTLVYIVLQLGWFSYSRYKEYTNDKSKT